VGDEVEPGWAESSDEQLSSDAREEGAEGLREEDEEEERPAYIGVVSAAVSKE